jgi:cysteine-rich repeat protein
MSFAESPSVIPGTPRGIPGLGFFESGAAFLVGGAAALVALTGCECSSSDQAEARAVDDSGHDAGRGTGGAPVAKEGGVAGRTDDSSVKPAKGGTGGHAFDAAREARGSDALVDAAAPVSRVCGDGIRGLDEECDDGNTDDTDFCTSACLVHDRLALAADNLPFPSFKKRELSRGYHVFAGTKRSAALVFVDATASPRELRVVLYRTDGTRIGGDAGINVSEDRIPIDATDGVVAALPGDAYAVAWSVFPSGGSYPSVALRKVEGATGVLGPIQTVSSLLNGNQEAPDLVWTGSELVVTWMDRTDPLLPQGRVRRYDGNLNPLGDEEALSGDGSEEGVPTLAAFAGSYAALWLESTSNSDTDLHVRAGDTAWTVPGIFRLAGDGFRLSALDEEHLFAIWAQIDYLTDGGYEVATLYGAVFDVKAPGAVSPFRIKALSAALTDDPTRGYREPALAVVGSSAFVAWASEPGVLGGLDGALVMKEMPWRAGNGGIDLTLAEEPMARNRMMQNTSFELAPALASIPWTSGGTLSAAWEDSQRAFGSEELTPDVVAELLPVPIVRLGAKDGGADAQ